MDVLTFYAMLGALCREHAGRSEQCERCPACGFCYTAPGSVTEAQLEALIVQLPSPAGDGATKRNSRAFPDR